MGLARERITAFGLMVLGVLISIVAAANASDCPKDVVTQANACFTNYSIRSQSMKTSPIKLCCGVDVETLRALCRSFMDGMKCVKRLKNQCPADQDKMIDNSLRNLQGATQSMTDLCEDDTIIENYAMYQTCFTFVGHLSEECFKMHLDGDDNLSRSGSSIGFLSYVDTGNKEKFCRNLQATVTCVQRNVNSSCGPQAAQMASVLVKPMVRFSTDCEYRVYVANQDGQRSYQGNPPYISDDHAADGKGNSNNNDNSIDRSGSPSKRKSSTPRNTGSHLSTVAFTVSLCSLFSIISIFLYSYDTL